MKKFSITKNIVSLATLGLMSVNPASAKEEVEVLHWWTSGGEAKALNVLKDDLQKQGVSWKDMPVAGGGGTQAMTVLRARVASGDAPAAAQMLGFDIVDWGEQGVVANLNNVAKEEKWESVVPAALKKFSKYEGKWIAAPVNVHSTNWVWGNKAIFDELKLSQPKNFDELIAALDKIKKAGYIPLAHGGQAWQDATLFESVLLTTGGTDFYQKALIDLDEKALGSAKMLKTFERMEKLRQYVDPNFPGRDWNLASAMVIEKKAGLQVMGDWAKGEFLRAKKVPGKDFLCFRFPGTQGKVTFNSDQFVMFAVDKGKKSAQSKLAKSVMSPKFQSAFNVVKGSVPARTDVSDKAFDACGKKGMKDLKEAAASGNLLGSLAHGYGAPAAVKNAVYDVVTKHFNGGISSKDAVKELVAVVNAAK